MAILRFSYDFCKSNKFDLFIAFSNIPQLASIYKHNLHKTKPLVKQLKKDFESLVSMGIKDFAS